MDPDRLIKNGFALFVGLVFLALGGWLRAKDVDEAEHWVEVRGTVVDSVKRRDVERNEDTWAPVVEYEVDGEKRRLNGRYETYRQSEGNPAVLRYEPSDPDGTVHLVGALDGLIPFALLALGGLSFVTGAVGFARALRRTHPR
ncbi:MAG: DUF3592 domain-containing protein [Myxococcota bacterium]